MTGSEKKYPGLNPLPPDFAKEFPPVAAVVEEKCIACDRCPPICFFDAIVMEARAKHKYKRTAVVVEGNCTGCGLCFEACPVDAIVETRIYEYHMEQRGENILTKDMLLAIGDKYEAMIINK